MVAIFGNHKTARAALGDSELFSSRLNPGGSGARAIFTAPAPEPSRAVATLNVQEEKNCIEDGVPAG